MATDSSHDLEGPLSDNHDLITTEQQRIVYEGIQAVASRCDGAVSLDKKGFNGQDTHFGRRISAMSFEEWTPEIHAEAARIANVYREQILSYTGHDVRNLAIVRAREDAETNHVARSQARQDEKRRNHISDRKARLTTDGIDLSWSSKDPDCFGVLLTEVKRLPGRRYSNGHNYVALSIEALDFIERHSVEADFDIDSERAKLVPVESVTLNVGGTAVQAPPAKPADIVLLNDRQVRIRFPYNPDMVTAVRSLPGRTYDDGRYGEAKSNLADLHPEVLAFADRFGLVVAPEVTDALSGAMEAHAAVQSAADLNEAVSRLADPSALPADFLAKLIESGAKVEVSA